MFAFITVKPNNVEWMLEDGRTGSDPRPQGPVTEHSVFHPATVTEHGTTFVSNAEKNRMAADDAKARLRALGADEFQIRFDC